MKKHFSLFVSQLPGAHTADIYRFERRQKIDGNIILGEPKVELLGSLRMDEAGKVVLRLNRERA